MLAVAGQREAALDSFQRSLVLTERLPATADVRQHLAVIYNKIGDTLAASGRRQEALASYRKSLAIIEKLAADEPDNTLWQAHLASPGATSASRRLARKPAAYRKAPRSAPFAAMTRAMQPGNAILRRA
jgi:tetratricopeptide (TPR) repeat protein